MSEPSTIVLQRAGASTAPLAEALAAAIDPAEPRIHRPSVTPPDSANAAFCFDPASLEAAARAGVPFRVAILPTFDTRWSGSFDEAQALLVAHDHLLAALPHGVRSRAHVLGPLAPRGWAPPADRAALQAERELDAPVALVPASLLEVAGVTPLLMQLGLSPARYLFDVGLDVEAAEVLRAHAPTHDLDAALFARVPPSGDDPGALPYWQLADVVVARPGSLEATLALAVGAGLVLLLEPGDERAAEALERSGCAIRADAPSTLSVALDDALRRRADLGQAARDLGAPEAAERALALLEKLRDDAGAPKPPRGLPAGLERLPRAGEPPRRSAPNDGPSEPGDADADEEARIDRELAALKERLAGDD